MFSFSVGGFRFSGAGSSSPGPGPMTPAYVSLDPFNNETSRTYTAGVNRAIVSGIVPGNGNAALQLSLGLTTNPTVTTVPIPNTDNPSVAWPPGSIIAVAVRPGVGPYPAINAVQPSIMIPETAGTDYAWFNRTGVVLPVGYTFQSSWGDGYTDWQSWGVGEMKVGSNAGAPLSGATGTSKRMRLQFQQGSTVGRPNFPITVDAAVVITAPFKSQLFISFDDTTKQTRTEALARMEATNTARGLTGNQRLRATAYISKDIVISGEGGNAGNMNIADLNALKAAGWLLGTDSGSDNGGEPATSFPTVAAAVDSMEANIDYMISVGVLTEAERAGSRHTVFSFGTSTYANSTAAAPATVTIFGTGGVPLTTLTTSSAYSATNILAAGARLKNSLYPLGVRIVSCPSSTSIAVASPISLAANTAFDICAVCLNVTVAPTGNNRITNINTRTLLAGMQAHGTNVPANTTITAIITEGVAGEIELSNNIPASATNIGFGFFDEEFAVGKLADHMISRGYRSARNAGASFSICSQFGVSPQRAMQLQNDNFEATPALETLALIDAGIANGRDISIFGHARPATNYAIWDALFNGIADRILAGTIEVCTINEGWAKWQDRAFA